MSKEEQLDTKSRILRDKHNLYVLVIPSITADWTYKIINLGNEQVETPPYKGVCGSDFGSYYNALNAGIEECENLLKKQS